MDDLAGLDWQSSKYKPSQTPSTANYYPSLKPTPPLSRSSTPAIQGPLDPPNPSSSVAARSNGATPASDSFANLVSFKSAQPTPNLSLQEQQRRLEEQKTQQYRRPYAPATGLGSDDGAFWDKLGGGRNTPNSVTSPPAYAATSEYGGHKLSAAINKPFEGINRSSNHTRRERAADGEEDLLSGFENAANERQRHVGNPTTARSTSPRRPKRNSVKPAAKDVGDDLQIELDDDPFGLGTTNGKKAAGNGRAVVEAVNDDDVLGPLGRPVSEFQQQSKPERGPVWNTNSETSHPQDQAVAELVEMGFSAEKSRQALESTESGINVQAAVSWLLNQAHRDSVQGSQTPSNDRNTSQPRKERRRSSGSRTKSATPAWLRQNGASQDQHRQNSRSPASGDKDPSKIASELGNNLFKTANSLWKTGTKKLNQAVTDFNSDSDSSQPKWMREARLEADSHRQRSQRRESEADDIDRRAVKAMQQAIAKQKEDDVTEEALMLESRDARPARKPPPRSKPEGSVMSRQSSDTQSPVLNDRPRVQDVRQPRFMQQAPSRDPRSILNKQVIEEQASEAYISPARRKKTTPKPTTERRPPSAEPDLLLGASQLLKAQPPTHRAQSSPATTFRPTTIDALPTRRVPPKRTIPPVSPSAISTSNKSRLTGTEAFKRGDYAEATIRYTNALSSLPSKHPLTIPLLTNRALSHSKTGDPKASVADATTALELIGPSRGSSETIDLGDEGSKDMSLFWGKAMTRKAEALEQLERWPDALLAWKSCVEAGVGGATSIAGRNRCDKATNPTPAKPAAPKKPPPRPKPRSTALEDLPSRPTATSLQSAEAVSRLRAANLEAERVDDEKFALSDSVSERLQSWRAGKEGNLRALLASLENVLWEGAGWRKIGMGELILPGKVKVWYMKGIAKVHPDKVSVEFLLFSFFRRGKGACRGRCADFGGGTVTDNGDDGAEDDQCSCVRHFERGVGWVQAGEWLVSRVMGLMSPAYPKQSYKVCIPSMIASSSSIFYLKPIRHLHCRQVSLSTLPYLATGSPSLPADPFPPFFLFRRLPAPKPVPPTTHPLSHSAEPDPMNLRLSSPSPLSPPHPSSRKPPHIPLSISLFQSPIFHDLLRRTWLARRA